MHKEYKQWKKLLANKYLLTAYGIGIFILILFAVNFIVHLLERVPEMLSSIKSAAINGSQSQEIPSMFEGVSILWIFDFKTEYSLVYLLIACAAIIFILRHLYKIRIAFRDLNKHTKGSTRWTTVKEIKKTYKAVKDNDEEYKGSAGVPIVHHGDSLYVDTNNTHTLVVASTQSGKTEMYSYPYLDVIMRAKKKDSVIITDVKGDMLKNTKDQFEKYGYDVHVLNLINPDWGIAYNPLELIKEAYLEGNYAKAQMLCNSFSYALYHKDNSNTDPIWEESSIALVNALILAVCELCVQNNEPENITIYTLTVMLNELGSNPDEDGYTRLDHFFGNLPPSNPAKLQYGTIQFSQGVTRSGIYTGTMGKLKNFTYDTIGRMTAKNDLRLEDLAYGKKPIALFIVYPDWDDSNYVLISTFISQVNAVLSEKATLSRKSKLPRTVRHLFEEVANVPPLPGMSRAMALGLSRGLLYTLVIQNRAQLADVYGEKMAAAIMGNCGNQIYIMSDEVEDAEEFSKKLGAETIIVADRQGPLMGTDKTYGEREEERPLLRPDELRRLKKGEWVVSRTKKRENHKKQRIEAFPIFASIKNGTQMLHRYEYLMHRFNNEIALGELDIKGSHQNIDLNSLLIEFKMNDFDNEKTKSSKKQEKVTPDETGEMPGQIESLLESIAEYEESSDEELEVSESEGIMDSLEEVYSTETPILDAMSEDSYFYIQQVAKSLLSDEEFNYFLNLETIEELRSFFKTPEKHEIYTVVEKHLLQGV
ncbi:VirD4-like conjugal transfer protein, CD1115 family [Bacillus pumilus]|uniref:VirD4-like conjugal transfer protein, CD1115 family n=1 Tax=Bacillus pumilus TaxID=1408 RepID=UPI0011A13AFA|nr:type IV secretory system conjugative DNA transfer family protein [Bacillus pumilus]